VTLHAHVVVFIARHFPRLMRFLILRAGVKSRPQPRAARS
jgi:hypothetical protein